MVEGGKTPIQSADELGFIGFRIVIFPGGTARALAHTLQRYYASLHTYRTTAPMSDHMLDFDQLSDVIGTAALLEERKKYG
jgi:2-methylisocitrate lyase-like PEP mutase family enzyme